MVVAWANQSPGSPLTARVNAVEVDLDSAATRVSQIVLCYKKIELESEVASLQARISALNGAIILQP